MGGDLRVDPGHTGGTAPHSWTGNVSVSPWRRLQRGKSGRFCIDCCPHDPELDKQKKLIERWTDFNPAQTIVKENDT